MKMEIDIKMVADGINKAFTTNIKQNDYRSALLMNYGIYDSIPLK